MKSLVAIFLAMVTTVVLMPSQAQTTEWTAGPITNLHVPAELILQHERLRNLTAIGNPAAVKVYGNLRMAFREVLTDRQDEKSVAAPASVQITYRNRLVAAATGYRLGGDFTHNGVFIESWDGGNSCDYTRWKLEFRGERMQLTETKRFPTKSCGNN